MAGAQPTLGVVLAGGFSRRFGSDKRAALLGGETLLARAVKRAAPQVERVLVVGGAWAMPNALSIPDDEAGQGPLAGVIAGLRWAEKQGYARVATFPCDVPFFPSDTVLRLSGALGEQDDCVMARRGAQTHAVFALWRVRCREALARAFAGGLRSLHGVADVLASTTASFDAAGAPAFDPFFNVNRVEDLELARNLLEGS